jgi:leucyl-tRNA synthetase
MQGYDVFEPIGLDGFGIHSENYAIKVGRHPKEHARISEKNFYAQLRAIGNRFAWDHKLETYDPNYYKWTQWLFIQMYKAGLAYCGEAIVNWCPKDKTVLADEQVENGACERCGTSVERRKMSSWYFKITEYADRLLEGLDKINWPEKIKTAQRQWIGKNEGVNVDFKISGTKKTITCFTTRLDTILGVTFLVVSPEYAQAHLSLNDKTSKYIKESLKKSEQDRKNRLGDKTGVDTGIKVINPATNDEVPVWISDYVLMEVGTGAVMGVPALDERDQEFAKRFKLPIKKTKLVDIKLGQKHTHYHLRDWLISRQRYWGPPIPMIYCEKCGWQTVSEDDLPVLLPDITEFQPKGDGTSPLANAPLEWQNVKCPSCGGIAKRELDVSDTFLDSAWYFLRYPSVDTYNAPWDEEVTKKWLPVTTYIGGAEHAVLHLLYARFVWKVLKDRKLIKGVASDEPFPFLFGHGLIIKDGAKMSKSKGNVVNPDEYIEKFGADTLRMYLMFLGPYDQGGDFRDTGIEGMQRFLMRVWNVFVNPRNFPEENKEEQKLVNIKMHQTIKRMSNDIQKFHYNTAISAIMEYVSVLRTQGASMENLKILAQLIAPFAPHMAEEAWCNVLNQKYSVHNSQWPEFNAQLIESDTVSIIVQVNGKMRAELVVDVQTSKNKSEIEKLARNDDRVSKWLVKSYKAHIVFVPGKIINFVTK